MSRWDILSCYNNRSENNESHNTDLCMIFRNAEFNRTHKYQSFLRTRPDDLAVCFNFQASSMFQRPKSNDCARFKPAPDAAVKMLPKFSSG